MKRRGLIAIIALAMSFPVGAAEQQSEQSLGSQQQTYAPSLGDEECAGPLVRFYRLFRTGLCVGLIGRGTVAG